MIRLRGGWESRSGPGLATRRTLPLAPENAPAGPIAFARWFQSPPIDPAREGVELSVEDVPGLTAVRLNGLTLQSQPRAPLNGLLPGRNLLEIDADVPAALEVPWGAIALVIVPLTD